jgi:hypothetical protein
VGISAVRRRSWRRTVSWRRSISVKAAAAFPVLNLPIACGAEVDFLHIFIEVLRESPYGVFLFLLPAFLFRSLPFIESAFIFPGEVATVPRGSEIRIRWRSTGREHLRGFGGNPLDAVDHSLWGLVACRNSFERMVNELTVRAI